MACAGTVLIVSVNSCESVVRADQRSALFILLLPLFLVTVTDLSSDQQLHCLVKRIQNPLRICRQVSSTLPMTSVGLQHFVSECSKSVHTAGYASEHRYWYCREGIEVLWADSCGKFYYEAVKNLVIRLKFMDSRILRPLQEIECQSFNGVCFQES
jgi:hypothetical protein